MAYEDRDNVNMSTDGVCLFSEDGSHLVRCTAAVEHYEVPASCRFIDAKAFAYNTTLKSIRFPGQLEEIGDHAFVSSKLESVTIPPSVRSIGQRAFAGSASLRSLQLAEGLERIGAGAFEGLASLERLYIPASVTFIGSGLRRVSGRRPGAQTIVSIDPRNAHYLIDESGVLYCRTAEGLVLEEALQTVSGDYAVLEGTTDIKPDSLVCNTFLKSVTVPEGVTDIGARAFEDCIHLESALLPSSLKSIGDEAFCRCLDLKQAHLPEGLLSIGSNAFGHTSLEQVEIPASLEHLGHLAFVLDGYLPHDPADGTHASCYGIPKGYSYDSPNSTGYWMIESIDSPFDAPRKAAAMAAGRLNGLGGSAISVAEGNERFFVSDDFLCENASDGTVRAILYIGSSQVIVVPRNVSEICASALNQAIDVRELHLHKGIARIGTNALKLSRALELVHVELENGQDLCVYPAVGSMGVIAQNFGFMHGWLDVDSLVNSCDASLSRMEGGFEKLWRIVERLDNGQLLSDENRAVFEKEIVDGLDELIAGYARLDDLDGLDTLLRMGVIGPDNIVHAIDKAGEAGGAMATHYLLERKAQLNLNAMADLRL